ncbi:hypothetical protein [Yinghuangia soli]|uniref:Uncharacterized protein n=1 Tax=Yinghuangia soli TaxID=2908204 RepID=A0AA41QAL7_9ACTN|nr:hypothetical protein [Yinghuangia soli]MCF2533796.1 hypothetical protein [Yinghuangia soli]
MSQLQVVINADILTEPVIDLWNTLLDLSERVPPAWTLIGGQMVLLHGMEHDRVPPTVSQDLDVLADLVSEPRSLHRLVAALGDLGFRVDGMSAEGKAHRYKRASKANHLTVDLLAPDHMGKHADLTTTPPGTTLEVPGGRRALERTADVSVQLGHRTGTIRRPDLLGAIVGKSAALGIAATSREKHYRDLAFLLSLPTAPLTLRAELTRSDRKKLALARELADMDHAAWRALDDDEAAEDGYALLLLLTS